MSYGGFVVIPASSMGEPEESNAKRSFLLSVFHKPNDSNAREGYTTSVVWSFPEGENGFKDESKRQELGAIAVDSAFAKQEIWDGGSLRVHYNPTTGKPDHLCRTVFDEGIECMPLSVSVHGGYPVVELAGKSQMFLSKEQTAAFCRVEDATAPVAAHAWKWRTTFVTGLDVQWDDFNGTPERIFFGCWGGTGGYGNFGSVQKNGDNLRRVMSGAHAEAVLFLPQELEGTINPPEPIPIDNSRSSVNEAREAEAALANGSVSNSRTLVAGLAMIAVALCLAIYKKRRMRNALYSSPLPNSLQRELGFAAQYVELQTLEDSSSEMLS